jgi:hypothetical protein
LLNLHGRDNPWQTSRQQRPAEEDSSVMNKKMSYLPAKLPEDSVPWRCPLFGQKSVWCRMNLLNADWTDQKLRYIKKVQEINGKSRGKNDAPLKGVEIFPAGAYDP